MKDFCLCEKDLNWCAICLPNASSPSYFDGNDLYSSNILIAFLSITSLFDFIVSLAPCLFQTIGLLVDPTAGVSSSKLF